MMSGGNHILCFPTHASEPKQKDGIEIEDLEGKKGLHCRFVSLFDPR